MTAGGWIFMIASVGFVAGLMGYCYYRVFVGQQKTTKPPDIVGG
jgi:hypothetical protein